ncbi:MAG TPA: hypothetical protein VIL28_04400 [Steroidobacteraceae bacterium]
MRATRLLFAAGLLVYGAAVSADVGASLRAGTLGVGAELNVGLTETLNLRVGYSLFDYDDTIEETDLRYDGELKLRNATALLDWHMFGGGFRVSFGAVGASTEIDVVGTPTGGFYDIGDETFAADEVGSLRGKIKMGNDVAPYVGIGWGNPVDKDGRITFLFDLGAVYTGSPDVNLTAQCGPALAGDPTRCAVLQQEVRREADELADESTSYEWWPVVSIGLAVRF